jgi:hypothetical protein
MVDGTKRRPRRERIGVEKRMEGRKGEKKKTPTNRGDMHAPPSMWVFDHSRADSLMLLG